MFIAYHLAQTILFTNKLILRNGTAMTVKTCILPEKNILLRTITGHITLSEIKESINHSMADPKFAKNMDVIWDIKNATVDRFGPDEIYDVVEFLQQKSAQRGECYRIAFIADKELAYGIARMFMGYSGELPLTVTIHRSMEEALHWLEGKAQYATG